MITLFKILLLFFIISSVFRILTKILFSSRQKNSKKKPTFYRTSNSGYEKDISSDARIIEEKKDE